MKVSSSAYYAYVRRASYGETSKQRTCREKVRKCFYENRRRYGSRRIAKQLRIGRFRVRTAMKRENLKAIARQRFKPQTTDSKHDARISPNLLQDAMNQPFNKGEVIVGDITYLPLKGGRFCYLACFQDKFTRRIVGWQVSQRMTAQLVTRCLKSGTKTPFDQAKCDHSHGSRKPICGG
jgi:transposase InsO family protein